jgi:type III secretory pathway component EscV
MFRFRVTVDTGNSTIFRDFFVNVIGGAGQFVVGDVNELADKGKWVEVMMFRYNKEDFETFQAWAATAMQWYENPLYMVTDFLITLGMLFVIPQVDFLIISAVAIVIFIYRKRIKQTWEQRQLDRSYGDVEDKMRKQRAYEEKERLRELEAYPTEKALIKYGSGDMRSRATAYHQGIRQYDGATFSTAYSLVHLGELVFNEDEKAAQRGEQIIELLTEQYHSTLEKSWVFMDIAACCRALSSEAVDVKTKHILKDKWMEISKLAETRASEEVAKATKDIHLKQNSITFDEVLRKQREKKTDSGANKE